MIDLVCVAAELYNLVTDLSISHGMGEEVGHRFVCVTFSAVGAGPVAPTPPRVRVCRPQGFGGLDDLPDCCTPAATACLPALVSLSQELAGGSLTPADGFAQLTSLLQRHGQRAQRALRQHMPQQFSLPTTWWDEECAAAAADFKGKSASFQLARTAAGLARGDALEPGSALHALHTTMAQARAVYARLKKCKKREWEEARETAMIDAYFSHKQCDFWRAFFGTPPAIRLHDTAVWTNHFNGLLNPPPPAGAPPQPAAAVPEREAFEEACRCRAQPDLLADLGGEITDGEVRAAIDELAAGKAADLQGLTAEALQLFLLHAGCGDALVTSIAHLLNMCVHSGALPDQICTSKLVPVPKGAPSADPTQYRGIAVSSIFARVLDGVLFGRGNTACESLGLRPPAQCGFREDHGTLDALFTLNHLIEEARSDRVPLFVGAVDFKAAFDSVPWWGLVQRAELLGFPGEFVKKLRTTFEGNQLVVCIDGEQGVPILASRGTKQGSKISPLIFGLFLEQFVELRGMLDPSLGPQVGTMRVPEIMYADDIIFALREEAQLQQMFDILSIFCYMFGMEVNPSKTKVIVFLPKGVRGQHLVAITYRGEALTQVSELKYLGLLFSCKHPLGQSHKPKAAASGRAALFKMQARCRASSLRQPDLLCRLFSNLVEPVISYGCQVWGPEYFNKLDGPWGDAMHGVHTVFLRMLCGVGPSTHTRTLLREFSQQPLVFHWAALAARFWNRLCKMRQSRLLRQAFLANINLCIVKKSKQCWVYRMLRLARTLNYIPCHPGSMTVASVLALRFDEDTLCTDLGRKFRAFWANAHASPRDAPSTHVTAATYVRWVGMGEGEHVKAPHLFTSLPFPLRRALVSIRIGSHKLEVQCGRFRSIPRSQRVCRLHDASHVEDVMHFVLDCPAYAAIRARFACLFDPLRTISAPDERLCALFATQHQHALALCLHHMLKHRAALVGGHRSALQRR